MATVAPSQTFSAAASLTPELPAGFRFAPVLIGRTGRAQVAHLPCPVWCVEDHLGEPVGNVEDVMHRGEQSDLCIKSVAFAPIPHQLYAYLASDPVAADPRLRAAYIAVDNADASSMAFLTPEMAEKAADSAAEFAVELRRLARAAREANEMAA